jgi:hypothetical protein
MKNIGLKRWMMADYQFPSISIITAKSSKGQLLFLAVDWKYVRIWGGRGLKGGN